VDDLLADLRRELGELALTEAAKVGRSLQLREDGHVVDGSDVAGCGPPGRSLDESDRSAVMP
jgi:hypothetical protein